jgi:hypothetical protein
MKIRRFFYRIKNIIRWIPTLWKDFDWDHTYLYEIMYQKIHFMRLYHEKSQLFVGVEIEIKWMKICEKLLRDLIDSEYWKDEYDNKYLNTKNMKLSDYHIDHYKADLKNISLITYVKSELREQKAKELLFKILSWRVEYWWD